MNEELQQGRCRCGAVRVTAAGSPLVTMACHCRGCQYMSASAFSLSSLYGADRFRVVEGEPVLGGLKGATRHYFCPSCMTWMFTRPEGMDDYVNVRSTLFDDPGLHRPYIETHCREALPGVATGAVERFDTVPGNDRFGTLIGAYAEWSGSDDMKEKDTQ